MTQRYGPSLINCYHFHNWHSHHKLLFALLIYKYSFYLSVFLLFRLFFFVPFSGFIFIIWFLSHSVCVWWNGINSKWTKKKRLFHSCMLDIWIIYPLERKKAREFYVRHKKRKTRKRKKRNTENKRECRTTKSLSTKTRAPTARDAAIVRSKRLAHKEQTYRFHRNEGGEKREKRKTIEKSSVEK